MGVLTDLIIADKVEAETIANSSSPLSTWKGIDAKGYDLITFGTLTCILSNKNYDDSILDEFPLLAQSSDEGPWVIELSNDLVFQLNKLGEDEIPSVVSKWLTTEEMQNATKEYAEGFVKELKFLANESITNQKSILMWICL